jgi:hypothetical protein
MGKWRDAAENIELEIGHGSHRTERHKHLTREQQKAAAEKLRVLSSQDCPDGVDATMVAS